LGDRKDIGIYPLKQFAHVIHGNPNHQGRTAMGFPFAERYLFVRQRCVHLKKTASGYLVFLDKRVKGKNLGGAKRYVLK
jgi:hypothetical protein